MLRAEKQKQTVAGIGCQLCGTTDHDINSCQLTAPAPETQVEDANYVNNFNRGQRNDPFSNTYNPGWRQHPNLSYGNNVKPQTTSTRPSNKSNIEALLEKMTATMINLSEEVVGLGKNIKIMEQQIAQQAANTPRPAGQLPGQTEVNPKGSVSAVTLRNGKEY